MNKNALRNILIILLLLVLVPTAFYTVYEFSTLNSNEQMLSEMYNRQLDAILFSVNDYAWTVVNGWANTISRTYEREQGSHVQRPDALKQLVNRNAEISYLMFADSLGETISVIPGSATPDLQSRLPVKALSGRASQLQRLLRYAKTGYVKLEPMYVGESANRDSLVVLVFALNSSHADKFAGIGLNDSRFIQNVIGRKLLEVAGDNFVLGVTDKNTNTIVFSTSQTGVGELRQRKRLWLFPGYELGIRLKGTTIDELAQSRTRRNVMLIVLMDVVLLAGAWFVYRSIRREMELVRLKSDFVSNVSHELRTPLALIRMYGETLEMGRVTNDEKRQEYYGTIVKESERLTRLVNNILDFSKMEAGKKQYSFSEVQLNDVVHTVMATYDFHLKNEGFSAAVLCDEPLPTITADVEAVTEALVNLIDNAVKYSREEKYLKVKTFLRNSRCVIEVEDHGVGIATEHQTRIFDKFFRVGSVLVHNTKGSGLGLTLVRHIMDAHGGQIEVDSVVGKGSTFRLLFPEG